MRKIALSLLCGLVLAASCAAPTDPLLSTDTVETGTVCARTTADGTTSIKFDIVRNITDQAVQILSVELDSPQDVELVAAAVDRDLEGSHVGTDDPVKVAPDWAPLVLAPDEQAVVHVILRPTRLDTYGWTNGLWVLAEDEQGGRVRIHTCHALLTSPARDCQTDWQPLDEDALASVCGYSEAA